MLNLSVRSICICVIWRVFSVGVIVGGVWSYSGLSRRNGANLTGGGISWL
jgi:hypothetical protein